MENLARETPIFTVMEGSEPPFFTRFFTWDLAKSLVSRLVIGLATEIVYSSTSEQFEVHTVENSMINALI
jgi:hypothetical protein